MGWLESLFFGEGIAHSVLVLSIVIAMGVALGKIKIAGISLGVTWILFVGIFFSHFGMLIDEHILHFVKEFGLILFVYSIGMQVGPAFFSSFKKGGIQFNLLAAGVVFLGVVITYIIHITAHVSLPTMVGILSGAVTNTPGLGAAQQAYTDATGITDPTIAMGYAVAYPLGVIGIIGSLILLRKIFSVDFDKETRDMQERNKGVGGMATRFSVEVQNPFINGKSVLRLRRLLNRQFVVSRVYRTNGVTDIATADTILNLGDKLFIVANDSVDLISDFIGVKIDMDQTQWDMLDDQLISRQVRITKSKLNGKHLGELNLRSGFGVNITRVTRAGVDLIPSRALQVQMGDMLTLVGHESTIKSVEGLLGNSEKRLNEPNLIPIFLGIFVGVILGSIPFVVPGIPQPLKLGLAGGPLIISILLSKFGPKYKLVTYSTLSANLMLREIGIALFLACVGLGAGAGFVDTVVNQGGFYWIGYGVLITVVPLMIIGIIGRKIFKINYFSLMGLLAGSSTDPPALAYSNATAGNDLPAVSYATVYPLTMFLRIIAAQLLILFAV